METDLLDAAKAVVAMTYDEARNSDGSLLYCDFDALNPCFDGAWRSAPNKHWSGLGAACKSCVLRAAIFSA